MDQLLQPPLCHREMSPCIRRKDLALACRGCQKTARGDGGAGRWLKDAKEAKEEKKAKTQKACRGKRNPGPHIYTPMEGQRASKKVGAVFTFNDLPNPSLKVRR
jgi:hypothetical protein